MQKLKSKNNFKNIYYFWACDYSKISGEGLLANLFIKNFKNINKRIKVLTVDNLNIKNNKIKNLLKYKYITPFFGILVCWYFFLKGKKVGYLNYLPFWNFILFLSFPPNIILGPVTGGAKFNKRYQFFIRKYLFHIFYKLSEIIIFIRKKKIYFATDLLKKKLNKYTISNSKFNFVFKKININKNISFKEKKIDFLIYYKNHKNKNIRFPYEFIKKLIYLNYKVYVVGDHLEIIGIKNLGYISNEKIISILKKTFFTVSSNENLYSIFNLECINNKVKIITTEKNINIKYFKSNYLHLNKYIFKNIKNFINKNKSN